MESINKTRRQFVATTAVASGLMLGACASGGNSSGNTPPANAGGNQAEENPEPAPKAPVKPAGIAYGFGRAGKSGPFFVGRTDLSTGKAIFSQKINFFGHGLSVNPTNPNHGVVFEKHGAGCAEIDLTTGDTLRVIKTLDSREFYGHGAFSPDGKTLYAAETEVENETYKGVVGVRDGESFEYKGDFPTFGIAPHDCHLIDDGETLVFTNGGGAFGGDDFGCITYVDVKSKSHKKTVKISDPELNAGHMTILSNGDFVVVSAPRDGLNKKDAPGNVSFYDRADDKLRAAVDNPMRNRMLLETLSVAVHEESGIVAATNPAGNIVTFWDFKSGKFVHSITSYNKPRGVSLTKDGAHFVITHSPTLQDMEIDLINAETFKPIENGNIKDTYMSGSHVVVL
ncbi:MAG: DUF1513 domain-containing protein [Planctomycetota bacterium]|jgi:hypothetical protein